MTDHCCSSLFDTIFEIFTDEYHALAHAVWQQRERHLGLHAALADEHGIELDKRDVEQEAPYQELLELGGNADLIPYLWDGQQLVNGNDECLAYLRERYL